MQFPFRDVLPETELAYSAITEAARRVIEIYNTAFEASEKADKSPVTAADIESHRAIAGVLSGSGLPIVSEEGEQAEIRSDRFWLVDPLDGTREFVDRNGEFTIMIALVSGSEPAVGAISHPLANSVYIAQKGQGAYRYDGEGWERLGVSEVATLAGSEAVISRSHVSPEELGFIESLGVSGYVRLGSSLKALRICSGEAELYFAANSKMKQWDTCASHCLVTESGGKMTDMFGRGMAYTAGPAAHERGVVITNGRIHDEFISKAGPMRARLA